MLDCVLGFKKKYGAGVSYLRRNCCRFFEINVDQLRETFLHERKRSMNYSKAFLPFRNQPNIFGISVNANEFSGLNVFFIGSN